jgi:hypothetical protein
VLAGSDGPRGTSVPKTLFARISGGGRPRGLSPLGRVSPPVATILLAA